MLISSRSYAGSSVASFAILMLLACVVSELRAEIALFPQPLHLTRKVESAIDGSIQIIDEFYSGNRVVSVSGSKTTIADYQKQELVTIDRASRTFMVVTFEAIAAEGSACTPAPCGDHASSSPSSFGSRPAPTVLPGNRERFQLSVDDRPEERLIVTIDRAISVSRDALDVIVGSAYPNAGSPEAGRVRMVAAREGSSTRLRSQASESADYGLPVENTTTISTPAGDVTFGSVVTRIGHEVAPEALMTIPADFRQIESPRGRSKRLLEELDRLPATGSSRP